MTTPDLCTDTVWYSKPPGTGSPPPRERSSTPAVFEQVPHWLQVLLSYDSDAWLLESNGGEGLYFLAETDAIAATDVASAMTWANQHLTDLDIAEFSTSGCLRMAWPFVRVRGRTGWTPLESDYLTNRSYHDDLHRATADIDACCAWRFPAMPRLS